MSEPFFPCRSGKPEYGHCECSAMECYDGWGQRGCFLYKSVEEFLEFCRREKHQPGFDE